MVEKETSITQHYEFESFMSNVSLSNFTETLLEKKEILIDNDLSKGALIKDLRDKYFRSIISKEIIEETFFEDLDSYIFYHNKNYDVEKIVKIDKVFDIDMSFFASNTVKQYMFYLDFLAEYYRNLAELKKKKHRLDTEIFQHEFNIKIRIIPIGKINKYTSVSIKKDYTTEDKNYINIKFKLNNVNKYLDLTNINPSAIFKTMQIDKDLDGEYVDSIRILFNKIRITNELSIEKRPDYNHLIGLSYKYRFYRLLLDYYVLIIYYIFIRYKRNIIVENTDYNSGGAIKYGEIKKIMEDFKIIFQNYTIKFIKLMRIMQSVKKDDRIQESERIAESVKYKNQLIKFNKNIDIRNTQLKRYQVELKNGNTNDKNSKTLFIITIITLVISLIIYLSLINYNDINVARTVSPILLIFIIIILLITNYIKNTTYSETFELEPENIEFSEAATSATILDLEERKKQLTDNIASIDDLNNAWDDEGIETVIDKTSGQYEDDARGTWQEEARKKRDYKTEYWENLNTWGDIDFARTEHIKNIEQQLKDLNSEYNSAVSTEDSIKKRRSTVKAQVTTVTAQLKKTEASVQARFRTIARLNKLLGEYQDLTNELGGVVAKKSAIRETKIAKSRELSRENNNLARQIRDKYQEIADSQTKFDEMSDKLKSIILRNEELDEEIKTINTQNLQEQAKTVTTHAQAMTAIAEYRETLASANASAAKIANLKSMIENEDLEIQKWSKEIVRLEGETRAKAENAKTMAKKATFQANAVLKIIEEKIQKIKKEIADAPKSIILKIDLNLNYSLVGSSGSAKRDTFKNNIIIELSNALLEPPNRFEVLDNIEKGSIILTIKIYPSKSYDSRQLTHTQIADKIIEQSKSSDNTPIKLSKYLRFVQKVGIVAIDGVLTAQHAVEKPLDYNYETMGIIMKNNSDEIDNILENLILVEGLHNKNRTYYDEVNPHLKLEVKKFDTIDKQSDIKENILKSTYNISKHSINYNDNLSSLLINITLLIGVLFLLQSYFDKNIAFINIIAIIIFAIMIIIFFINIMKPVRTRINNKYWGKPISQLKRIS